MLGKSQAELLLYLNGGGIWSIRRLLFEFGYPWTYDQMNASLKRLVKRELVKHTKTGITSWYEITPKGRKELFNASK